MPTGKNKKKFPKINREVEVGLLIKSDYSYYTTIQEGIKNAKKMLFTSNNVDSASIVRIANDAVYINGSVDLQYRKFDDVEFKIKSISNVMVNLSNNIIIFVWYNDDGLNIDVKGLKPEIQELHNEYILSVIASTIDLVERSSISDALSYLSKFIDDYLNLRLDKYFYRELNPSSHFHYKYSNFYFDNIEDINDIDINYNLIILRELWGILIEKYNVGIK